MKILPLVAGFMAVAGSVLAQTETTYTSVALPNDFVGHAPIGQYTIYLDSSVKHNGHLVPTIKALHPQAFATILSSTIPKKCLGKRIMYTAWVKSKDVDGWSGLWLRIDPADESKTQPLGFDNMSNRPIKGTTDWKQYHIVLDVPKEAGSLVYGILLDGPGQIWLDYQDIKIVSKNTPLTITEKTL
ncbi:MAG: hypothetical protein ACTHJ0_05740 [Flavipsychrobacter sp.]